MDNHSISLFCFNGYTSTEFQINLFQTQQSISSKIISRHANSELGLNEYVCICDRRLCTTSLPGIEVVRGSTPSFILIPFQLQWNALVS